MKKKLIVLGLDGCDFFTIRDNIEKLHGWKEMLNDGLSLTPLWTSVRSVRPWKFDSAMLWTTLFSGLKPEEHGIYGYEKWIGDKGIGEYHKLKDASKVRFVWEHRTNLNVTYWQVPVIVPPVENISLPNIKSKDQAKVVVDFLEWKKGIDELMEKKDWDVLISVFAGLDIHQHHNYDDKKSILKMCDDIGKAMKVWTKDKESLVFSDHGFTDIDTALKQGWTWKVSKEKNHDKGHHAPWGMCLTSMDTKPYETTEVAESIRGWMREHDKK